MALSRRIAGYLTKSSWIRSMFEAGLEMKAKYGRENVSDLSLGNPYLEPPPEFGEELRRLAENPIPGMHQYMVNAGYPETREAVAEHLSAETGLPFTQKQIVMSVGAAMQDWYVTRPIGVSDGKGGFSFDEPPKINTTLVLNSLYWMTDKADYIAAGPGSNKTMGTVNEETEVVLKAVSLAGFPMVVLIVGAVVMFFRRR